MIARDIFVSYSRRDQELVQSLIDCFEFHEITCWFDKIELVGGQDWKLEIARAIQKSKLFICCLSRNSVDKRGFFHTEMKLALEEAERVPEGEMFILPILLEDCEVPRSLKRWHLVRCFDVDGCRNLFRAVSTGLNQEDSIDESRLAAVQAQLLLYGARETSGVVYDLELLDNLVTIDILDRQGESARLTRKSTFIAMRDNVSGYTEHMSADGDLDGFVVAPGEITERRVEGGDLFLRREFGTTINAGDTIVQTLSHKLRGSFLQNPEDRSIRVILPTKQFTLRINFPEERPYTSFKGYHRVGAEDLLYAVQPVELATESGISLSWTVADPETKDIYKISWLW